MTDVQGQAVSGSGDGQAARPTPSPTARVVAYPSHMIRPIPSFVFSVPPGWVLDEAPDALAVVRTPQEVDGFWINAILSHDRVPRSVDFKSAAQATFARLQRSSPSAKVTMERMARFGANVVYLRGVELDAPKSGKRLGQVHALFFGPVEGEGKTIDFFQIVATAPAELMTQCTPAFVELIRSFRFV